MGSTLLDNSAEAPQEEAAPSGFLGAGPPGPASVLRRQAAERLAAHHSRRNGAVPDLHPPPSSSPRNARSARIAAAVAQRYATSPSYRDFLAAEAERAVEQARAAAEVAAVNAQAMAAAHRSLLHALEAETAGEASAKPLERPTETIEETLAAPLLWPELAAEARCERETHQAFRPPSSRAKPKRASRVRSEAAEVGESALNHGPPLPQAPAAGITIRLYQDESGATRVALGAPAAPRAASASPAGPVWSEGPLTEEEARLLEEEIAFRHEPVFDEPAGPPTPLPANLIEFPRQLVAARKARPRLAEGPLRDEAGDVPGAGQLRIFEVDPEQIATAPEDDCTTASAARSAQWTTIWLDSQPRAERIQAGADGERSADSGAADRRATTGLKEIASVQRRMLAASINAGILAAGFAGLAAMALWVAGHLPAHSAAPLPMRAEGIAFLNRSALQSALPFAICAFTLLAAIYQALFFVLSTATPGMRAARIALCTFADENPTRAAIRRRLAALLLSGIPMGLGFLWAALDEERLSWHDRLCGIYQRSY